MSAFLPPGIHQFLGRMRVANLADQPARDERYLVMAKTHSELDPLKVLLQRALAGEIVEQTEHRWVLRAGIILNFIVASRAYMHAGVGLDGAWVYLVDSIMPLRDVRAALADKDGWLVVTSVEVIL